MQTSAVSFGRVTAVTGQTKKMEKINRKLYDYIKSGRVVVKDVTSFYRNSSPSGEIARAAQRGEIVDVYVTGDDINKIRNKEPNWKTIKDILGHVENYFSVKDCSISQAIKNILGQA